MVQGTPRGIEIYVAGLEMCVMEAKFPSSVYCLTLVAKSAIQIGGVHTAQRVPRSVFWVTVTEICKYSSVSLAISVYIFFLSLPNSVKFFVKSDTLVLHKIEVMHFL
jgi:hypothetical protein